jgi:chromosome segregation ATPase
MNYTRKEYIHQMQERIKVIEAANVDYELELAKKDREIDELKLQRDVLSGGFEQLRSELYAAKKENERLLEEITRLQRELSNYTYFY